MNNSYAKYIQLLYLNNLAKECLDSQFIDGQNKINNKVVNLCNLRDKQTELISEEQMMKHIEIIDSKLNCFQQIISVNESNINNINKELIDDLISSIEYNINKLSLGNDISLNEKEFWNNINSFIKSHKNKEGLNSKVSNTLKEINDNLANLIEKQNQIKESKLLLKEEEEIKEKALIKNRIINIFNEIESINMQILQDLLN